MLVQVSVVVGEQHPAKALAALVEAGGDQHEQVMRELVGQVGGSAMTQAIGHWTSN